MAIIPKPRLFKDQRVKHLAQVYATNRPLVQRGLTVGFVLYVLTAAYRGLFARQVSRRRDEGKDAARKDGKSARVAVRFSYLLPDDGSQRTRLMPYFIKGWASSCVSLYQACVPRRPCCWLCTQVSSSFALLSRYTSPLWMESAFSR
jgi:hypothetical protein